MGNLDHKGDKGYAEDDKDQTANHIFQRHVEQDEENRFDPDSIVHKEETKSIDNYIDIYHQRGSDKTQVVNSSGSSVARSPIKLRTMSLQTLQRNSFSFSMYELKDRSAKRTNEKLFSVHEQHNNHSIQSIRK